MAVIYSSQVHIIGGGTQPHRSSSVRPNDITKHVGDIAGKQDKHGLGNREANKSCIFPNLVSFL